MKVILGLTNDTRTNPSNKLEWFATITKGPVFGIFSLPIILSLKINLKIIKLKLLIIIYNKILPLK